MCSMTRIHASYTRHMILNRANCVVVCQLSLRLFDWANTTSSRLMSLLQGPGLCDDAKQPEMMATTMRLSQRQDLLEGIHPEGVLSYLQRHGVLDSAVLAGLGKKATTKEINSIILRHVEGQGKPALTLLINALRQSWQLQLANCLDPDQKIRPTPDNNYFGRHRYKGQITIRIQIEALRITVHESRQEIITGDTIICQDCTSAETECTQKVSPPGVEKTEELSKPQFLNTRSSCDELDGSPLEDNNDEDFVKPKSCWCFCLFRKKKSKSKKDSAKQQTAEGYRLDKMNKIQTPDTNHVLSPNANDKKINSKHHRRKLKKASKMKNDVRESTLSKCSVKGEKGEDKGDGFRLNEKYSNRQLMSSKSGISEGYSVTERINSLQANELDRARSLSQVDVRFIRDETGHGGGETSRSDQPDSARGPRNTRNYNIEHFHNLLHQPYIQTRSAGQISNKDYLHSVSSDHKYRLDIATVKANNNNLVIPKRQSGHTYVTSRDLTSADRDFKQRASELCARIVHELHTEIIKYFEQERGILVFDISAQENGIKIVSICLARSQVTSLQQDFQSGSLLRKIEEMVAKVDTAIFEIEKIRMKIGVDDAEMKTVLGEHS